MDRIKAEAVDCGKRLDVFLSERAGFTRSAAQKLLENGCVAVNGKIAAKNYKIKETDEVRVEMPEPRVVNAEPQNIPLDIVYEDKDIIVVNKPQGMVVHPAAGNFDGTLVNALMFHYKRESVCHERRDSARHCAQNRQGHQRHFGGGQNKCRRTFALAEQIKAHTVTREYICLIHGGTNWDELTVDKPIGRDPKDRKRMIAGASVLKDGRDAVTHFSVNQRYQGYTLLGCRLETGRTHQIRVHLKSIGKHIVGDPVYGLKEDRLAKSAGLCGQLLHAQKLGFIHPATGKYVEFTSALPDYFLCILDKLQAL